MKAIHGRLMLISISFFQFRKELKLLPFPPFQYPFLFQTSTDAVATAELLSDAAAASAAELLSGE